MLHLVVNVRCKSVILIFYIFFSFLKIDCLVTTAGGIEEDIMKCLAPSYLGDFRLKDKELRTKGLNRIGNLIVPNENYCKFEDWCLPVLDKMKLEQDQEVRRSTGEAH